MDVANVVVLELPQWGIGENENRANDLALLSSSWLHSKEERWRVPKMHPFWIRIESVIDPWLPMTWASMMTLEDSFLP